MKRRNLSRLSCIFVQAVGWQEVDSGARNWVDYYWLRSPLPTDTVSVCIVDASGLSVMVTMPIGLPAARVLLSKSLLTSGEMG